MKTAVVTGSAGFIGARVAERWLSEGWRVVGIDCFSEYYDPRLKRDRARRLASHDAYVEIEDRIERPGLLSEVFGTYRPEVVVHLAAQAGVRYSIEAPRSYLDSNISGTFELLEAARAHPPAHMLLASTSSVYGANTEMPYAETHKADSQMSFYAATKKATEAMAHSYAHLYRLPMTMFRFFTVYGPWGRPDMALFKFVKAILEDRPIDVYNHGKMKRDFTFIDDLVEAVDALAACTPVHAVGEFDSLSPVAPFRIVNIGKSEPDSLGGFITAIEDALGRSARRNLMDMQPGDVPATWSDTRLLAALTGKCPNTPLSVGVPAFVKWYKDYYGVA
ncbi:NAD-dependent epimerase/dehydratase family protein [Silicimonas sp. MF1-12-2]|uniref:NAD-dependent epimerase/dehydratase family protein n=1 Tax=Silicimonas sp. MF1-12-2 TaxID=3384793 RepID=UPI0039B6A145